MRVDAEHAALTRRATPARSDFVRVPGVGHDALEHARVRVGLAKPYPNTNPNPNPNPKQAGHDALEHVGVALEAWWRTEVRDG